MTSTRLSIFCGTPDRIRTYDLWLRKPTLYPAELRVLTLKGNLRFSFNDTFGMNPNSPCGETYLLPFPRKRFVLTNFAKSCASRALQNLRGGVCVSERLTQEQIVLVVAGNWSIAPTRTGVILTFSPVKSYRAREPKATIFWS